MSLLQLEATRTLSVGLAIRLLTYVSISVSQIQAQKGLRDCPQRANMARPRQEEPYVV